MTSRLRPLARTLRSAVAAAINKAICGTKADSCKSTGPRYRGHPTSMGDGFASEPGLVEKDLSRGEASICCNDPLFHGCLRRRSLSNSNFRRPLRHHRANHVHHSAAHSEARPQARQRRLGKDRRLSVQTRFSALHEPPQQSCIWICISSARQTSSCITRTGKRRGPRPRTTFMGAWCVNR